MTGSCSFSLGMLLWSWALAGATVVSAATYYVDFAGGDDAADGLTPRTAWKHSPGDRNATGNPASAALKPGDTVLFKGGVAYRGSLRLSASGAPGNPITLDGNTAGNFGTGRAVVDGGRIIEGWRRCASAEEAGGNPRWREIFIADIDLDIAVNFNHGQVVVHRQQPRDRQAPWQRVILCDGEQKLLPIAQWPKPADPFYPDLPADFLQSPNRLEVRDGRTRLVDTKNLAGKDAKFFEGMFVGVHGGNNHTYFAAVTGFEPAKSELQFAPFKDTTYPTTRFALYNSPRLIEQPGEWAIAPTGAGRTRIWLLADRLQNGQPDNIGFPELETGIAITDGASHLRVQGFLIQRFSGGGGAVAIERSNNRSKGITVSDCEIRFVSGHAGVGPHFCDDIVIERCYIYQCPAWTTAIFLNRVNNYVVRNNRLVKNSGSGIRHYEAKHGRIQDNVVLDHFGMHSSGINLYEGCFDVVLERNYIQNTIAINRNAEKLVLRNNVIDGAGKAAVGIAMWNSGRTGGRAIKDIEISNNTIVNLNTETAWATGVLGQRSGSPSSPTGLSIRNNVLYRVSDDLQGVFENNLYGRDVEARFKGPGCQVITDWSGLFRDPAKMDYRRKPGSPMMNAGADVPPPPERWERK